MPDQVVMVNPHQQGCAYPHKDLCGVGVACKVLQALCSRLGVDPVAMLYCDLEFVAFGTVCDVVSLVDPENRWFVRQGLKRAQHSLNVGFRALMGVSNVSPRTLTEQDFGWAMGPRVNSVGRLANANRVVHMILSESERHAESLAHHVHEVDLKRKKLSDVVFADAWAEMEEMGTGRDRAAFVLGDDRWHPGVVGIGAGKIAPRVGRPVFLMGRAPSGHWTGSARAGGKRVHLKEVLSAVAPLLDRFGGHRAAAGFSLIRKDAFAVDEFREAIEGVVSSQLPHDERSGVVEADAEVRLSDLEEESYTQVKQWMAPFGEGNPKPIFVSRAVRVMKVQRVGDDGKHLKLTVEQDGCRIGAIGFGLGARGGDLRPGHRLDIAYAWEENTFRGHTEKQLRLEDAGSSVG